MSRSKENRTVSLPPGERQSWIVNEPVRAIRILGTRFGEFPLEPEMGMVEVGSEPAELAGNGSPAARRFVIRNAHVSRRHCSIEYRSGRWVVFADPEAKNGIYLGEERRTTFELVPGLRFRIGPVPLVAVGAAEQMARPRVERYFGLSDARAVAVDAVVALAHDRRHVIVQQPPGGGGLGIARAIHEAAPRASFPFSAPTKIPTKASDQIEMLREAAYGTLVLSVDKLPKDRAALLRELTAWTYQVRLIALAPRGQRVSTAVGDELLTASALVTVPTLVERRAELPELVSLLRGEARLKLGDHAVDFTGREWKFIKKHTWPDNLEELERFVERVLALRSRSGRLREAAAAVGIAPSTMAKWMKKFRIKELMSSRS